jgi:hypothetical protein
VDQSPNVVPSRYTRSSHIGRLLATGREEPYTKQNHGHCMCSPAIVSKGTICIRLSFGYQVYYQPAPLGQIGRSAHTGAGDLAYRLNTVRSAYDLAYDCQTTRYAADMPYPDTVMLYCVIWHTDVQTSRAGMSDIDTGESPVSWHQHQNNADP